MYIFIVVLKNGWVIKTSTKSFAVYAATPTEKVSECFDF